MSKILQKTGLLEQYTEPLVRKKLIHGGASLFITDWKKTSLRLEEVHNYYITRFTSKRKVGRNSAKNCEKLFVEPRSTFPSKS